MSTVDERNSTVLLRARVSSGSHSLTFVIVLFRIDGPDV